MNELKPCPFCGAENTDVGFIHHTDDCYLVRRYLNHPTATLKTPWNNRPIEDQLRARVAELEARLDIGTGNMYDVVCAENESLREELMNYAVNVCPEKDRQYDELRAQAQTLEIENDRYETALNRIKNWAEAYPVDIFPEPDFKKVRELLGDSLLSCVSAANMRHVINGVKEIVSAALEATK